MSAPYRVLGRGGRALLVALVVAGAPGCSVLGEVYRPPVRGVDLNTASLEELAKLPGLSEADAARIVAQRPYRIEEELVYKGVVTQEHLERFGKLTYVSRVRTDGGEEARSCTAAVPLEATSDASSDSPDREDEP